MDSNRESEAAHRARVVRATHGLRARLEGRRLLPVLRRQSVPSSLPFEPPEQVVVPSERCLICGGEAAAGMLLPGSVVFYFCEYHLGPGQRLAENAWRDHREREEQEELSARMRERVEELWLQLLRSVQIP